MPAKLSVGSGPIPRPGTLMRSIDARLDGWFTGHHGPARLVASALAGTIAFLLLIRPFDLPSLAPASQAGVAVVEARLTHLAYSPEIAEAMLRRQQATAIVAARQKIVEGAVGMVRLALEHLKADGIVELDEERKAAMVSNLLVVLCGEHAAQPVVNTGTLYQ
jgi:hypothetical protein